jgi:hypothetical protein
MLKQSKPALVALAFAALAASPLHAIVAKVTNPPSLLATKKVLLIHGTATSDHNNALRALGAKFRDIQAIYNFQMDTVKVGTSGGNPASGALDQYDIIIFNYWFDTQLSATAFQTAFKAWANSTNKRRGWIGMHTSGANTDGEWNWLRDSVTSMRYLIHSTAVQAGTIRRRTSDPFVTNHPIMQSMPDTFRVPSDEWYDWETTAPTYPDIKVMYDLDETTLSTAPTHPMNPHPMAWFRENPVTRNRYFYTPLVHSAPGVTSTAGNDFFASLMMRAMEYVAGYDTTGVFLNGRGVYESGKHQAQVLRRGDVLKLKVDAPYRLQLVDLKGRVLFSASGRGGREYSYRPDALRKPGVYVIRVASKSGSYSQRVMVQ